MLDLLPLPKIDGIIIYCIVIVIILTASAD
jgi:hypothetical protein